jgi:hypothetical protein
MVRVNHMGKDCLIGVFWEHKCSFLLLCLPSSLFPSRLSKHHVYSIFLSVLWGLEKPDRLYRPACSWAEYLLGGAKPHILELLLTAG